MVITVYLSRTSGNIEIKKQQEHIIQILQGRKIEFEEIDISDPHCTEERDHMRKVGKTTGHNRYPLPPQIFTDSNYLGDYEAFYNSNEDDNLYEFLGESRPEEVSTQNGFHKEPQVEEKVESDEEKESPEDENEADQEDDNHEQQPDDKDASSDEEKDEETKVEQEDNVQGSDGEQETEEVKDSD
jgi:hypothetical protein